MPESRKYPVLWTRLASRDLFILVEYIAADNVDEAIRIFEKIRKTAAKLTMFPSRGRIVSELREQGVMAYRELIIGPWRIIYRFSGKTVYVLAVIDGRRNVEDILLERFLRTIRKGRD